MERRTKLAILIFTLLVFWICPGGLFAQGATPSTFDPQQARDGQSLPGCLPNDEIIKLVLAKMPDSVVLAKIKSSTCEFDTSSDALIKLKQAGVSDAVLQAMVEAPPPNPGGPEPEKPGGAGCNDYDACISSGNAALGSSPWNDAITAFNEAATLQPSKPDAWAGIGNAYLATDRTGEASAMWDKALGLGGRITFNVCRERGFSGCEAGDLNLGTKEVSFITANGQKLFSVVPSQVGVDKSFSSKLLRSGHFRLKVADKSYNFDVVPLGVNCDLQLVVKCPQEGFAQQLVVINYVPQTIPKLASGTLGKLSPPTPK